MPAIASLTRGVEGRERERERGVHTIGRIMERGLWIGCVIRVYTVYQTG